MNIDKMNITYTQAKKVFLMFANPDADKATVKANIRKWFAAMQILGEKHLLAKPVQKLAIPRSH